MKLKSLVMGSVLMAGLTTGANAADLSVLTSLDVCDALGISGLTISSDTNCLRISGNVDYRFRWGNWKSDPDQFGPFGLDSRNWDILDDNGGLDWESRVRWNLRFEASADSEFGTAMAVLNLHEESDYRSRNGVVTYGPYSTGTGPKLGDGSFVGASYSDGIVADEAYVQIGDSIVIMAGRKGTIAEHGTDTPYNFLGLFGTEETGIDVHVNGVYAMPSAGVWVNNSGAASAFTTDLRLGGDVIQVTADLGNGVFVAGGLENIDDATAARAGTLVGVIGYNGESVTAHATLLAGGVLDGTVESVGFHGGIEARFENVRVLGAIAAANTGGNLWWHAVGSAIATFDMFTLAGSVEADSVGDRGIGGSIGMAVTDDVTINGGFRYFEPAGGGADGGLDLAAEIVAAVTETVTLTGRLGVLVMGPAAINPSATVGYASGTVAWAPGGGFRTALTGEINALGGYRLSYTASKSFK